MLGGVDATRFTHLFAELVRCPGNVRVVAPAPNPAVEGRVASPIWLMGSHEAFAPKATSLAQEIMAGADPYESGMAMLSHAMSCIAEDSCECPHAFWLIWGCFTDCFDSPRADETSIAWATDAMQRACSEWLRIREANRTIVSTYLDRWVYDECGYATPRSSSRTRRKQG